MQEEYIRFEEQLHELRKKQDKHASEISEIKQALAELIQMQKNTTRNVNELSNDVKEMLKKSLSHEMQEKEIKILHERIDSLEETKTWTFRLVTGAIIMAVLSLLFDGSIVHHVK